MKEVGDDVVCEEGVEDVRTVCRKTLIDHDVSKIFQNEPGLPIDETDWL